MVNMNRLDKRYQDLLQDILDNGVEKKDSYPCGATSYRFESCPDYKQKKINI
jgi:hypothetical protein